MNALAKPKTKLNLSAVTPPPPPVDDAGTIDTKTPADTTVQRFNPQLLPKWGPWLLARMSAVWPNIAPWNYQSQLGLHASSNGSLLINSKTALLLAVRTVDTFEPRPAVDVVFCFKHRPDNSEEDKDVRVLFRHLDNWARGLGAREIRIRNFDAIDVDPSRAKNILGGDEGRFFVKEVKDVK